MVEDAKLLCFADRGDRGGMFCISGELKFYQGSEEEWIGSFTGQDIGNLVPRPTQRRQTFGLGYEKGAVKANPEPPLGYWSLKQRNMPVDVAIPGLALGRLVGLLVQGIWAVVWPRWFARDVYGW